MPKSSGICESISVNYYEFIFLMAINTEARRGNEQNTFIYNFQYHDIIQSIVNEKID